MHIYLENGDGMSIARKISEIDGIIGVSVHIGNSDIVAEMAYRNSIYPS